MKPFLSICIPTLNRPEYLAQSIKSIIANKSTFSSIEICISNNASDHDYSVVDLLLDSIGDLLLVRYIRHKNRLSLDENHHFVKKMATSDHIYFLGDDDFFLEDGIEKLLNYIKKYNPDLAIFNGVLVDSKNKIIGRHFNLPPKEYRTVGEAFTDLRDKGMFGAVLVRRTLLQDEDFVRLYGTSHGYGCYWLTLLRNCDQLKVVKISIPDFECVALRVAKKNYDQVEVYFRDIPFEIAVYNRFAGFGAAFELLAEFNFNYFKKISSIKFLCAISHTGSELNNIKKINLKFYKENFIKIKFSRFIAKSYTYDILKVTCKNIKNRHNK